MLVSFEGLFRAIVNLGKMLAVVVDGVRSRGRRGRSNNVNCVYDNSRIGSRRHENAVD